MNNMTTRAIHCFLSKEGLGDTLVLIIPCGDVKLTRNGRNIEQDSSNTDLQGQNVFTLVTG